MDKPTSYAVVEGTTIQELMDEVNAWMRREVDALRWSL